MDEIKTDTEAKAKDLQDEVTFTHVEKFFFDIIMTIIYTSILRRPLTRCYLLISLTDGVEALPVEGRLQAHARHPQGGNQGNSISSVMINVPAFSAFVYYESSVGLL
jgi:hypothetical protein